ncbi:hypothetical protein FFI87_024935 [Burkholderia sp. KBS0801]|jgi:hypothetical protein|nr:hypothetical protein FFI87_024935 [Burkholderia sp. KBS0801]
MGDDGTGHGQARVEKSFGARGGAARVGQSGVAMRQASVERYLIGVRPVLINVFVGDLVEF